MRVMALDYGERGVGVAISDELQLTARPLTTIRRQKQRYAQVIERIRELVAENGVATLVVGLPLNMDGSEGPRCQSTRQFAANLLKLKDFPILFWDERMSTLAVEREMIAHYLSRAKR
ncbi:MAG TPA: Holliday junction resolvase RuvX, partial [Blastocatellia bacterium]|nr:Holliday junction resolvase RuvX [Blastocatellia bacterium]